MKKDLLFQPLEFRNLTIKNRIFRSIVTGWTLDKNKINKIRECQSRTKFKEKGQVNAGTANSSAVYR